MLKHMHSGICVAHPRQHHVVGYSDSEFQAAVCLQWTAMDAEHPGQASRGHEEQLQALTRENVSLKTKPPDVHHSVRKKYICELISAAAARGDWTPARQGELPGEESRAPGRLQGRAHLQAGPQRRGQTDGTAQRLLMKGPFCQHLKIQIFHPGLQWSSNAPGISH